MLPGERADFLKWIARVSGNRATSVLHRGDQVEVEPGVIYTWICDES
jgi:hypothetical protein